MAAVLDSMERLIAEADHKFDEKFKQVQRGVPTNLSAYSDRTYNLRQQVAHNTQLTSDDHFMSLLQDTEQLLAVDFLARGDQDAKLYSMLAGLLKTLLRESVALPNYASRKIQIEMVWQWYHDKRGEVLEWATRRRDLGQSREVRGPVAGEAGDGGSNAAAPARTGGPILAADSGGDSKASHSTATEASQGHNNRSPQVASKFASKFEMLRAHPGDGGDPHPAATSVAPLTFLREAEQGRQHAASAKKLCLYTRRNLQRADLVRQQALAQLSGGAAGDGGASSRASQVRIVFTKDAQARRQQQQLLPGGATHRTAASAPRSRTAVAPTSSAAGPAGPPVFLHHSSRAPEFAAQTSADGDGGGAAAATKGGSKQRSGAVTAGSGAGSSGGGAATSSSSPVEPRGLDLDRAVANSHRHWVSHMVRKLEDEQDERVFRDSMAMFAMNAARVEEESARRIESGTYASQTGRTTHTILRRVPPHSTPTATAGVASALKATEGSGGGGRVDVTAAGGAQAPSPVTVRSTLPSASLSPEQVTALLGITTYSGTDVTLSPYDSYAPTALDEAKMHALLTRVQTPDAARGDARARLGLKAPHPRSMAATAARNTQLDVAVAPDAPVTSAQRPRSTAPVMELLFPALSGADDVPSLTHLQQMKLVERVRECFARATTKDGRPFRVPRKVIESALLTPDDRPYDECIRLLPHPGAGLPRDPNPRAATGGKKSGKKAAAVKKK